MVSFMLMLHPDPQRTIVETFYAKFGRSKLSLFAGRDSERDQKDNFGGKFAYLAILTPGMVFFMLILNSGHKREIRDLLSQISMVKIFSPRRGDSKMGKMTIFGHI